MKRELHVLGSIKIYQSNFSYLDAAVSFKIVALKDWIYTIP